jgi:hypothetical protein
MQIIQWEIYGVECSFVNKRNLLKIAVINHCSRKELLDTRLGALKNEMNKK